MGLVKTRRLAAMQKQQRAKAGMKPPAKWDANSEGGYNRKAQLPQRRTGL